MSEVEARAGGRLTTLGFTDRIAELLAASDVLITKPALARWPRLSIPECR